MNWGKAVRLAVDNWEGRTGTSDRDKLVWECTQSPAGHPEGVWAGGEPGDRRGGDVALAQERNCREELSEQAWRINCSKN